ncbi:uncharacterized protein LOC133192629 [Saccostrea echinata]|uniref:uncharacterized protein LOC133192629 n=1 Tax=Saccostrea echinata TaxID=191078 RepID=UPI002A83C84A|nr:uncharacterized protein LOC133192629 [Saccostrea echinata]
MMKFKDVIFKNFYKFDQWFENQWSEIENIGLHSFPEGKIKFTQANRNTFFTTFNKYLNSDEFEQSVMNLLQFYCQNLNGPHCRLLTSVLFYLEENFFLNLSPHLQLSDPIPLKKPSAECELDTSGRGKLRYLWVQCVIDSRKCTTEEMDSDISKLLYGMGPVELTSLQLLLTLLIQHLFFQNLKQVKQK